MHPHPLFFISANSSYFEERLVISSELIQFAKAPIWVSNQERVNPFKTNGIFQKI